jgi:phosphopantothenoylcysteine decarboxylase/phosphopantothenate--cysteine ligase
LISGPVCLTSPPGAAIVRVATADEMFEAVMRELENCDVFVMCAAVCDYKPAEYFSQKMKKQRGAFALELESTRDILASLTNRPNDCFVVGFAAETQELETNARRKLREKNCDMIVANDVSTPGLGMESDENALTIFYKNGAHENLPREKKTELARVLLKKILNAREKRLTKKT